jgi:hypothetical protein
MERVGFIGFPLIVTVVGIVSPAGLDPGRKLLLVS